MKKEITIESVPKIVDEFPTSKQMESFSREFSKKEWEKLTQNRLFRDALTTDLKKARVIATQILK